MDVNLDQYEEMDEMIRLGIRRTLVAHEGLVLGAGEAVAWMLDGADFTLPSARISSVA